MTHYLNQNSINSCLINILNVCSSDVEEPSSSTPAEETDEKEKSTEDDSTCNLDSKNDR